MSLSLRTINAPGIEITEVDRSQYTQTLTGTKVLVAGYADKGEDYATISPTSRSTLINVYGRPTNEEERYFYEACKEVIQQGGVLYSARLGYDNEMAGKYAAIDYALGGRKTVDGTTTVTEVVALDKIAETVSNFITADFDDVLTCNEETLEKYGLAVKDYKLSTGFVPCQTKSMPVSDYLFNYEACLDNIVSNIDQFVDFANELSLSNKEINSSDYDQDGVMDFLTDEETDIIPVASLLTSDMLLSDIVATHPYVILSFEPGELKIGETYYYAHDVDTQSEVYAALKNIDNTIKSVYEITCNGIPTLLSGDKFDNLATGEDQVDPGQIKIVDITRGTYGKTTFKGDGDTYYKECVGIVPVITTAANALFTQMLLSGNTSADYFNAVSGINTLQFTDSVNKEYSELSTVGHFTITEDDLAIPFGGHGTVDEDYQKALGDSLNARANAYFPAMYTETNSKGETVFNREYFKQIGIVVFKAYIDTASNNKINFDAVEAFVGSLDPQGKNIATGANIFIDNIVNSQSEYIRVFSNAKPAEDADILFVDNQPTGSLGFYESMTVKNISYQSIVQGLNKIFDRNSDLNEKEIDIVVDAGVSTIAGYIKDGEGAKLFDPTGPGNTGYKLKDGKKHWRAILDKYDTFCKNTRKDCMFIADGMRQFCLQGKKKIVRPSKPENTIDTKIIPNLIDMQVLNTNYGAGYCDWFEVVDEFSGDSFWCPPSIKAAGVYIYTDRHANYWDAPAGLNRGMVSANDVAFNPNVIQAGPIYLKNWNYAINYPDEGVILEGQKTMQMKPSAFDRVNVRRLFLRLERFVWKTARFFVYEPNTAYTRSRFVDALTPYFSEVKTAGGMYDFKIICDESINTPKVIDDNELRIRIGIKPTKTIEFILVEFVALKTGASWSELTNI